MDRARMKTGKVINLPGRDHEPKINVNVMNMPEGRKPKANVNVMNIPEGRKSTYNIEVIKLPPNAKE